MLTLGIDWAARYSAAVLMDEYKSVLAQWVVDLGGAEKPARLRKHIPAVNAFVEEMHNDVTMNNWNPTNIDIIIENVSHFMMNPAPVLRLQGVLEGQLYAYGFNTPRLILPNVWQTHFQFQKNKGGVKAPSTKMQAKALCEGFGYKFDIKGKAKVDLHDAALIARWGQEVKG